jgi:hypothetical protein
MNNNENPAWWDNPGALEWWDALDSNWRVLLKACFLKHGPLETEPVTTAHKRDLLRVVANVDCLRLHLPEVHSLEPVRHLLKLQQLHCAHTRVQDLAPLPHQLSGFAAALHPPEAPVVLPHRHHLPRASARPAHVGTPGSKRHRSICRNPPFPAPSARLPGVREHLARTEKHPENKKPRFFRSGAFAIKHVAQSAYSMLR